MSEHHELTNQEKLDEMYHLTLENNEILRSIRRNERVANFFRFLYWVIILGALSGVYFYVNPLIQKVVDNKIKFKVLLIS